ncbi:MAG: hypothetical protein WAO71_10330 [Gallionella sp.]
MANLDGIAKADAEPYLKRGLAILERLAKEDRLNANQKDWGQMFRDALAH